MHHDSERAFADADTAWKNADGARRDAQRQLDGGKAMLRQNADDLENRQKELEGTSAAVANMDSDLLKLQEQIAVVAAQASPEIRVAAEAGELTSSPEIADRDVKDTRERLERFRTEEPVPDPTIRDEYKLTLHNIQELEQHVLARQSEADAARSELDQCRGEYLQVIGSVLHDYRRRAGALAEIACAKLEIELPSLENSDKSIDEAGIVVRIGFDGKSPTEIGDTAHSGGQQVIAGLVLLMAMAETEGDSFFIVDEPFAHLSLDRIDEVGRFLRGSGSQFLITVPTTLDRGQLDPASLLVVLSKKKADEAFAPRPIIARV
jgi:DNA repair exonuclease SbcCD ATPase subunit